MARVRRGREEALKHPSRKKNRQGSLRQGGRPFRYMGKDSYPNGRVFHPLAAVDVNDVNRPAAL